MTEFMVKMGGRSLLRMALRLLNVVNCLQEGHVALCVMSRMIDSCTMLVKSDCTGDSLFPYKKY